MASTICNEDSAIINNTQLNDGNENSNDVTLPDGTTMLDTQVAGHPFNAKNNKIGMLRGPNGRVFKPITKSALGEREIEFYENLRISSNPVDIEMQRYTPNYYDTKEMRILNKRVKFIELEDITDGMSEPCVMDVKIGRRTWDPLADSEKRANEDLKYAESKAAYGFCIPGFQVYKVPSGTLKKYDKNYGKKLDEKTVVEALEIFLNATPNRPPCRDLVVRLLSILWKILALFREQRRYRIYSSSLLLAYDAKRLRHYMHRQLNNSFAESLLRTPISRSKTFSGGARSLSNLNHIGTPSPLASPSKTSMFYFPRPESPKNEYSSKSFNISPRPASPGSPKLEFSSKGLTLNLRPGSPKLEYSSKALNLSPRPGSPKLDSPTRSPKINRTIDRLQRLKRSISLQNCQVLPDKGIELTVKEPLSFSYTEWKPVKRTPDIKVQKLCRTHSYSNNFDADIIQMKEDYAAILSELTSTCEEKQNWVRVYMIDFAHVFPSEDGELDNNYLEGIESLIKLLEKFLA